MPHDAYKSLYIHIPFCKSKCAYSDFESEAIKQTNPYIERYIERLIEDIRKNSREGELEEIETVYIGGGTPTYIGSKHLTSLLYALSMHMNLSPDIECTLEGNPDSIDERLIRDIYALGVNRLSIGVQSFSDDMLKVLGRAHTSKDAKRAIYDAQTRIDNVSIDLMCGLPGQTLQMFEQDLKEAQNFGIKHISIYPLTIESGTKFEKLMRKGKLELPSDDLQADMMEMAESYLANAGFKRYEVANYAIPGFESKHNSSYWQAKPYLGIGDSAVTMTQNQERRMRVQDEQVIDDLDIKQMAAEDLMLAIRMTEGISFVRFSDYLDILPFAKDKFERLHSLDLIDITDSAYIPTSRGWLLGNELFGEILDLANNSI